MEGAEIGAKGRPADIVEVSRSRLPRHVAHDAGKRSETRMPAVCPMGARRIAAETRVCTRPNR